jgi:DNA-binding NarL/FixJ family response regulator
MPESAITILCVDDHPLIREGIGNMLDGQPDIRLVAIATNGREALEQYSEHRPNVTLMDLRLPDCHGADVIEKLRSRHAHAKIIALTTYAGDVQALRALRAGAMGYLLKSALRTELLTTIRAVQAGKRHISPEVEANISEHLTAEPLSEREVEVLRAVSAGRSNKAVASYLRLSEETIRVHLKNVFVKLSASDRTHAVVIAIRRGYILL